MAGERCTNCNLAVKRKKIENEEDTDYLWTVKSFRDYNEGYVLSPPFMRIGRRWRLKLHVNARADMLRQANGFLRITLHKFKDTEEVSSHDITVASSFSILDNCQRKLNEQTIIKKFMGNETKGYGCELISRLNVLVNDDTFLPQGNLTIACNIKLSEPLPVTESTYFKNMGDIFEQQEFGDVTFKVENKKFKAYKGILAAQSPVFAAMFVHQNFIENKTNEVVIEDCSAEAFEQLLKCAYTDTVDFSENTIEELVKMTDKYQMFRLKALCAVNCFKNLRINNVFSILILSDKYLLKKLKEAALYFIKDHWKDVMNSPDFKRLTIKPENHSLMMETLLYATK